MEWTKEQKQAIYEKGSNILVAAAAGSGKTAVLVERIINKIINEQTDIDRLLVVTFTNAAASEMRERILKAIYKKLDEDEGLNEKETENLQRQITLLNKASICTIDSFCLDVIKNNFYELDISPNFRIADTPEIELLKQELLEELFEDKYEKQNEEFINLIHTYTTYKDDTPLKELILKIYTYIQSNPFPEKWLEEQIEKFNIKEINQDFSKTEWGKILLEDIKEEIIDCQSILKEEIKNTARYPELDKYKQTLENDVDQLETLKINLDSWDKSYAINQNLEFITWPRNSKITLEQKDIAKTARDNVKKKLKKKTDKYLIFTSQEANQDIYDMYDKLKSLKNIILEFGQKLAKAKRDKNILDFNDIEHFALNILVKEKDGIAEPTEVAKKYQEKYIEIAIDEYQDSNLLQEYILTSISRKNNIFMVGDVKQSIYKFRQARPDLFYNKYTTYKLKDNMSTDDDLKIQLFKNFRSRKNVLDFTNIIFENIMAENPFEIEYNEEEFLNLGADYKENGQDLKIEINILETADKLPEDNPGSQAQNAECVEKEINSEEGEKPLDDNNEEEHIEDIELEARYITQRIQELIKSNYQVYDAKKQEFRPLKYKDIAILLRSTKTSAPIYEKELAKQDIPVFSDSGAEYLGSIEIQTIMSLLKIIDNPLQDIPLVSVLRSSIGGFTDNDLIQIRLNDKYDNFYNAILKAKLNVDERLKNKINNFLDNLEKWRKSKEYLALDELIWKIYIETEYYNYVGLMPNGALRQANLKMLFERAKQYESASFKGLFNFINFIEKVHTGSGDLGAAKIIGENEDVVRIMSIHKSKGLEFPVVFLANTGKSINLMDLKENILLHNEIGLGTKYIDYEKQIEYDTLSKAAISNKLYLETLSEEMRVLYVALTRPKEKLIITGTMLDTQKSIEKMEEQIARYPKTSEKINPILVKKYKKYIDWMLLVYKYNEKQIKDICSLNIINKKQIKSEKAVDKENVDNFIAKLENKKSNKEQYENIKQILEYVYPYLELSKIPTKASVSKLKEKALEQSTINESTETIRLEELIELNSSSMRKALNSEENLQEKRQSKFPKPKFLNDSEEEFTSAQKGTLMHLCMQKLDNTRDYIMQDVKELIENLKNTNRITEKEAENINTKKVYNFTQSEIWQRMKNAKEIYKEKAFYINIPIKDIYTELAENTSDGDILVQGIIDLYFIDENNKLVLLDYKTDYVELENEKALIQKYEMQLDFYKQAIENALNRKVDEVYIYSTWLDKLISF